MIIFLLLFWILWNTTTTTFAASVMRRKENKYNAVHLWVQDTLNHEIYNYCACILYYYLPVTRVSCINIYSSQINRYIFFFPFFLHPPKHLGISTTANSLAALCSLTDPHGVELVGLFQSGDGVSGPFIWSQTKGSGVFAPLLGF